MTACRSSRRGSSGSGSSGSGRRLVLAAAAAALVLLALLGGADARPRYSEKRGAKDGYRNIAANSRNFLSSLGDYIDKVIGEDEPSYGGAPVIGEEEPTYSEAPVIGDEEPSYGEAPAAGDDYGSSKGGDYSGSGSKGGPTYSGKPPHDDAGKRDDGAGKRDDGAGKRDDGASERDDGASKRDDERDEGAGKRDGKHSSDDDDDAASRKEQASSRRHRAKYDGGDGLKGCSTEGSPNPQRPDAYADNLLLSDGGFNWNATATPAAAATMAATRQAPREAPFPRYRQRTMRAGLEQARNRSRAMTAALQRSWPADKKKAAAKAAATPAPGVTDPSLLLPLVGGGNAVEQTGFYGVADGEFYPSDEALAAGPHPDDPSRALLLHGVNARLELFEAARDGKKLRSFGTVSLSDLVTLSRIPYAAKLSPADPTAFYDLEAERWVVVWVGIGIPAAPSPLFVAMSRTSDPRGDWLVKALDWGPPPGANWPQACPGTNTLLLDYPQTSYNQDGVFVSGILYCFSIGGEAWQDSMLWAVPKRDLYARGGGKVRGAAYTLLRAWTGSFPPDNPLVFSYSTTGAIMPVLPQARSDVVGKHQHTAFFVTQGGNISFTQADVSDRFAVGALLNTQRLDTMTGASDAPLVATNVIAKGLTFAGGLAANDNNNLALTLPQPRSRARLDAGDVGGFGRTYGSILHNGLIYTGMIELWGTAERNQNQVGIYYAVVDPGSKPLLCSEGIKKVAYGFFTGRDGIAVSYPVFGVTPSGDAVVAFVLSGNGSLPDAVGGGPAYAGVGTARIALPRDGADPLSSVPAALTLAKRGQQVVTDPGGSTFVRWGDYSAVGVHAGQAWFAVSSSRAAGSSPLGYGSWLTPRNVGQ